MVGSTLLPPSQPGDDGAAYKTLFSKTPGCGAFCNLPGFWKSTIRAEEATFSLLPTAAQPASEPGVLARAGRPLNNFWDTNNAPPGTHTHSDKELHFKDFAEDGSLRSFDNLDSEVWYDHIIFGERRAGMEEANWYKELALDPNAFNDRNLREPTR